MSWNWIGCLSLMVFSLPALAAEPDEVRRLIRQLDDPRFERREQADQALRRLGPDIVDLLEAELQSQPPLEVTLRLHNVLRVVGQTWRVNQRLERIWKDEGTSLPPRCDDLTFLRRATFDLAGRAPTRAEIDAFEKDQGNRKAVIDRLLASDEHADYWARLLAQRLLPETDPPAFSALHLWIKDQLVRQTSWKELTIQLLTASGTPEQNPAVHYLAAHLVGVPLPPERHAREGRLDMVQLTERTMHAFLGVRIQCAQCHDHAFNPEWRQKHYWSVNAFFRQLERTGRGATFELRDNPALNVSGSVSYQARNGRRFATPTPLEFLDGRPIATGTEAGRRRPELARLVTTHPYFSQAVVYRTWRHLFGTGLTAYADADDIGEHNEAIDQGLVDLLARDTAEAGHQHRLLLRWLMASRAYQARSSADPLVWQEGPLGRRPAKPLSFDQLFSTVIQLTGGPDDQREIQRRLIVGHLQSLDLDTPAREPLVFWLLNGLPGAPGGVLTPELLAQPVDAIIESLFLAALTRRPAAAESAALAKHILAELKESADPLPVWQDLLWALMNSSEFRVVR